MSGQRSTADDGSAAAECLGMDVIRWAAKECARQHSGEASVYRMLLAWVEAMNRQERGEMPSEEAIIALGRLVEPGKNAEGYRRVGVRVGWDIKGPWEAVPRQVRLLVESIGSMSADEWFREYEDIHPFRDGNGRTGSILWNWLNDSLSAPEEPPEFWGEREDVGL